MRVQTSIRVDEEFYKEAREVFKKFGLTFGDAVNIFLAKVAMEKGIPFDLKLAIFIFVDKKLSSSTVPSLTIRLLQLSKIIFSCFRNNGNIWIVVIHLCSFFF